MYHITDINGNKVDTSKLIRKYDGANGMFLTS